MPTTQYHKLLAQLDHVSQRLRAATGSAFLFGSGGEATAQTIQEAEIVQYSSTRFFGLRLGIMRQLIKT
ncbi:hypothetical protein [Mesorhizobium sp.]|uniref:hypothetical protein n=1 Tax=Mesorhizobium sp. TaxID=1871066 RepID=UPI000FE87B89|nr:hypothetical protein [Mesorhizobium sp.]RWK47462.1 MAG: hypothetical protein EOR48_32190 [Mesorhizobium sp.]TIP39329.1 MAG: hypothetical protein E5X62_31620 [Mesorhizobium sp.]